MLLLKNTCCPHSVRGYHPEKATLKSMNLSLTFHQKQYFLRISNTVENIQMHQVHLLSKASINLILI